LRTPDPLCRLAGGTFSLLDFIQVFLAVWRVGTVEKLGTLKCDHDERDYQL